METLLSAAAFVAFAKAMKCMLKEGFVECLAQMEDKFWSGVGTNAKKTLDKTKQFFKGLSGVFSTALKKAGDFFQKIYRPSSNYMERSIRIF